MASVIVKLLGLFRKTYGKDKVSFKITESISISDLIRLMTTSSPNFAKVIIDPELEDPRPNALILVNGKEISALNGLQTLLNDGDEVVLIPVTHGG